MTLTDTQAIEQACAKLINQFAVFNDMGRHEELAALFVENGRYARPTDPEKFAEGRAAILAAFKARPADRLTRHIIANIIVDVTSATTATGISYIALYTGSAAKTAEKGGFVGNASVLVGEFYDHFVLTSAGWRFSQRQGRLTLTT